MDDRQLYKYGMVSLAGAGVSTILFWLVVAPFDSFAGPEIPLHPLFVPAQILHLAASVLLLFGVTALYLRFRGSVGMFGTAAYVVASLGALGVFADGVLGLIVFPELARHAPELTSPAGPMFTGRVLGFYIGFFATNMLGLILLGAVLVRGGFEPRAASWLLILGAILSNLPPNPALHLVLVAGGLILGVAMVWLAFALLRTPASPVTGQV